MSKSETNSEQTFKKKVLVTIGIAILTILIILLAYFAIDVLFSMFAAILFAVLLRGLGEMLSKYTGISESYSVMLASLLIFVIIGLGFWWLAPNIAEQLMSIREYVPQAVEGIRQNLSGYSWGKLILEQIPAWEEIYTKLYSSQFLSRVGGIFSTTFGITANILVIILMGIYLAINPSTYTEGLKKLFPIPKRPRIQEVLDELKKTLRGWMIGKAASMMMVGILTTIGLYIIDVPLALALGVIAALLAFIPNFGPIIAVVPAGLFAFAQSPTKALYVLGLYFSIQLVESYLITPMIQKKVVSLPPVLTIFIQMFLGVLVGGLGLILATPLLAVSIVLVKMLYIEDVLEDSDVSLPGDDN